MNGFVTFYVNASLIQPDSPFHGQDMLQLLASIRDHNRELITSLKASGYECMFIPTWNESCHIEKVDLDKPYPRYAMPHVDLAENDRMYDEIMTRVKEENHG